MEAYKEKDIIKGCLQGEKACQKKLFDLYAAKMLGVCVRYCKSVTEAEDVLQEGFIKVFTHIRSYHEKGSLEGWIRRIMINTAINHLRKNKKFMYHEEIGSMQDLIEDEEQRVDDYNLEVILQCIQKLPEGYRTVFNLYEVEGYSHKEIARMLSVSVNTSKSQLLKAKRQLKNLLQNKK